MPIFQEDIDCHAPANPDPDDIFAAGRQYPRYPAVRRLSEESLPTELCEGPVPDSPLRTPSHSPDGEDLTSSREELIERIKKGESPTWIPTRHLESVFSHESSQEQRPKSSRTTSDSSNLLPPACITPDKEDSLLQDGLSLERPRSALHTGDFTDEEQVRGDRSPRRIEQPIERVWRSHSPWIATSPPRDFSPFLIENSSRSLLGRSPSTQSVASLSSSFAYQPPTSPLAHSQSNDELDIPGGLGGLGIRLPQSHTRRHTLYSLPQPSPYTSPSLQQSAHHPLLHIYRREGSFPSQAHQPRRSLPPTPQFVRSASSPHTRTALHSRRTSLGSDSSSLQQHASMVGSYEESILRGRMSTTPSKPLDFQAEIGVLGLGNCKARLRCPPHVILSFPAVYYSYSSTSHGRSQTDDGPSPYVGEIDLENGLPNQADDTRLKRKARTRYAERHFSEADSILTDADQLEGRDCRDSSKHKRSSTSQRAPPGGSYRIPEKGQLQIIIKNPNKTAVKLFLVPYDLAGMEPGTKTFIRQRCYSAGPIIDSIPEANSGDNSRSDRPVLRYLVHLHICSPSKGRFYLYKSIRVVFANRVPDGKEKLKNETTWPEPRFTPYKPVRANHPPLSAASGAGAALTADKAHKRRSSGFSFARFAHEFDLMDGTQPSFPSGAAPSSGFGNDTIKEHSLDPIPFRLPPRRRVASEASEASHTTNTEVRSPDSSQASRPSTKDSSGPSYTKLSKGDFGYGGLGFNQIMPGSPGIEGLLSQRLRSLGTKSPPTGESPHGSM